MRTLLTVMVAGALGAGCRYGLDGWVGDVTGGEFPWGTFVVNTSGCLAAGVLTTVLLDRFRIDPALRIAILVGFLGSFTTLSTLMIETTQLIGAGSLVAGIVNIAGGVAAAIIASVAGIALGRLL